MFQYIIPIVEFIKTNGTNGRIGIQNKWISNAMFVKEVAVKLSLGMDITFATLITLKNPQLGVTFPLSRSGS